jgi:hypothetical protein
MAKPLRSPLLGYNHNVKYKGRVYHVQTEDSGPTNPRLFTHLYYEGTILASKRHEYDANSAEDVVRGLMQGQHKAILKDLKQSLLDDKLEAFFSRRRERFALVDADATPPETPAPITQPVTPAAAAEAAAIPVTVVDPLSAPLDLDVLPVAIIEGPPPEVSHVQLPTGGPGVYAMKKSADGLRADSSASSHPAMPQAGHRGTGPATAHSNAGLPQAPAAPSASAAADAAIPAGASELMPVVVFDPSPSATPPPVPRPLGGPATPPRFPATSHTPRPTVSTGVVVQRQVVVGGGGAPAATGGAPSRTPPAARPRRPAPAIPYVVKEGSHVPSNQARPSVPPARPMVSPPNTSANAPRTASVHGSPPQADLISDKSLDEVILAYLSSGDAKE